MGFMGFDGVKPCAPSSEDTKQDGIHHQDNRPPSNVSDCGSNKASQASDLQGKIYCNVDDVNRWADNLEASAVIGSICGPSPPVEVLKSWMAINWATSFSCLRMLDLHDMC